MDISRICAHIRAALLYPSLAVSAIAVLAPQLASAQAPGPRVPVDLDSEAVREAITEQAAPNIQVRQREQDAPRCSQVPLQRGRIQLNRAAVGNGILRIEGCVGRPDSGDAQVWIRLGDRVVRRGADFQRTYAWLEAPAIASRRGAEATLVRTRGGETFQLTPWVGIEQVEADRDGDGHAATKWRGDDCDDTDPNRFPGNAEVADPSHDEDCDPTTIDSGTQLHGRSGDGDKDGDTFIDENVGNYGGRNYIPENAIYHIGQRDGRDFVYGTDCDDTRADVHPQQIEVCNGRDDNCDGRVDEGLRNCSD